VDLTGYDFESTATITVRLAQKMLRQPPPARTVLNVNGPAKVTDHKLEITRLDRRRWDKNVFESVATPDGPGWFTFLSDSDQDPFFEGKPGTDVAAITRGLVSISPLSFAWGEWRTQRHLHSWSRQIVNELNRVTEGELAQTPQRENGHDA
jgi:broad specificity polyphosphatase/5'/3'-nucleotidase SurE